MKLLWNKLSRIALILAALLAISSLAACKQEDALVYAFDESSTASLAQSLLDAGLFDDQLTQLDEEAASARFPYNQTYSLYYGSTGATSEMILMLRYDSADAAHAGVTRMQKYLSSQADLYATYNAAEVPKLKNAFCEVCGSWAILVVSNDASAAADLIRASRVKA